MVTHQESRSKYLSMLLRHKPEKAKLTLDREGWCSIEQLLTNTDFSRGELYDIVDQDEKSRYALSPDALNIRASQGHSTSGVKMTFKSAIPPPVLYHGATEQFIDQILKQGLKPMNRHHVHLSETLDVAETVGGRRKHGFVVLEIDAARMITAGLKFLISENGVWLIDHVPPEYLKEYK